MPGFSVTTSDSHSVSQSEFAPPLTLERIHSGLYFDARGKFGDWRRSISVVLVDPHLLP